MKNMNVCMFSGRLGADPETRSTQSGDKICNIRIAVDNTYKDRDGRDAGNTEWVPVVAFGHSANFADQYLRKGDKVIVRGQFRTRKWQDKDGNDRYSTEIVVDNFNGAIESCESRRDGDADRGGSDRGSGRGGSDRDSRDSRSRDDRGGRRDDDRGGRSDDRGRRDEGDRGRDDGRGRREERRDDPKDDRRGRSESQASRELDDDIPF